MSFGDDGRYRDTANLCLFVLLAILVRRHSTVDALGVPCLRQFGEVYMCISLLVTLLPSYKISRIAFPAVESLKYSCTRDGVLIRVEGSLRAESPTLTFHSYNAPSAHIEA